MQQNKAMTLLEVMVAMLILGLLAAGIYATFAVIGGMSGRFGLQDLKAVNYARQTLETLKNAVSTDPTRSAPLDAGDSPVEDLGDFDRNYTVEDVDIDFDTNYDYKRVTVTVSWND